VVRWHSYRENTMLALRCAPASLTEPPPISPPVSTLLS